VQLAVTWNLPHFGVTVAGQEFGSDVRNGSGMLYGVRLSAEQYRSLDIPKKVQVVEVEEELRPPFALETLLGAPRDRYGALLRKLQRFEEDPSVSGVLLVVGTVPVGLARTEELRQAVRRVADRKPVVAFMAAMGGTKSFWLASGATEVYAAPGSVIVAKGFASTSFFLRGGLAKLGVAFDAVAVGRYKNAPDTLTRSEASEAQREATASLLDAQFALLARAISEARHLPEGRVRELLDVGVFTCEEARQASLLDGALWPDEVEKRARELAGGAVLSRRVDESARRAADRWGPAPYVALIPVEGTIAPGASRQEPFTGSSIAGSDTVARLIRDATADPLARAIVLRVDSPGGDAFAADLLWRAVKEARRAGKPVVASMADAAASGGYLASVGADAIVAEPATLTGSIGVFALKPDVSGLLDKLGIGLWSDQRGQNARIDSIFKAWSPPERKLVERQLRVFYDEFVAKVAEGRRLSQDEVERVAQGRVWTGAQALSLKLVDRLGGLFDAVELAKELAGLDARDEIEVRRMETGTGLLGALARGLSAEPELLQSALARIPEVQAAALLGEMGTVLALPVDWVDGAPVEAGQ
jgi:protease-4